jgi:hypothetical protein
MKTETRGRALADFEKIIEEVYECSYSEGFVDGKKIGNEEGYQKGLEDAFDDESACEKINTQYVVEKFSDCKTLADFHGVFNEIQTRQLNYL